VSRLTVPVMAVVAVATGLVIFEPIRFYVTHGRLEEWMIYRVSFAGMLGTIGVTLLCATIVSEHVSALALLRYGRFTPRTRGLWRYETLGWLIAMALGLWLVAVALNLSGLRELLTPGHVTLHWSRVLLGAFFSINFVQLLATFCTLKIIRALHQRQPFLESDGRTTGIEG
jgi:hypothetical protein